MVSLPSSLSDSLHLAFLAAACRPTLSFFFSPPPARATFSRRRCRRSVWIFFSFPKGWAAAGRGSDAAPLREKREQRRFSVLTFSSGRIIVNNCLESPTNWANSAGVFGSFFLFCFFLCLNLGVITVALTHRFIIIQLPAQWCVVMLLDGKHLEPVHRTELTYTFTLHIWTWPKSSQQCSTSN